MGVRLAGSYGQLFRFVAAPCTVRATTAAGIVARVPAASFSPVVSDPSPPCGAAPTGDPSKETQ